MESPRPWLPMLQRLIKLCLLFKAYWMMIPLLLPTMRRLICLYFADLWCFYGLAYQFFSICVHSPFRGLTGAWGLFPTRCPILWSLALGWFCSPPGFGWCKSLRRYFWRDVKTCEAVTLEQLSRRSGVRHGVHEVDRYWACHYVREAQYCVQLDTGTRCADGATANNEPVYCNERLTLSLVKPLSLPVLLSVCLEWKLKEWLPR